MEATLLAIAAILFVAGLYMMTGGATPTQLGGCVLVLIAGGIAWTCLD
jgi:hypothetical protein